MPMIRTLSALEILDSRGRPTIAVQCALSDGTAASASVPSGASTGAAEALELRDGDPSRYQGLGCRKAVDHVNRALNDALARREFAQQADLDRAMIELDGTPNKSRLGANAILGVSIAFARSSAASIGVPLYRHFASILGTSPRLPTLTVNLFSGGKHAGEQVPIQDILLVPVSAESVDHSLSMVYAVYQSAAALAKTKYDSRPLVADEGGLSPPFPDVDSALQDAVDSIGAAGFEPGRDVALAIDIAATHFHRDGKYDLDGRPLSSRKMVEQIASWVSTFPIVSVEDGLAEDDWQNWPALRSALNGKALVMGDDLLCTNPPRIRRAVEARAANALLLKVNQIGTLTETAEAYQLARNANWSVTISARSGETEDNWLADLAVGWAGDYIKIGSITRSERLAKYNRLLAIEAELATKGAKGRRDKGTKR